MIFVKSLFCCSSFHPHLQPVEALISSYESLVGKINLQSFQFLEELYTIQFGTVVNLCFRKIKHWEDESGLRLIGRAVGETCARHLPTLFLDLALAVSVIP